MIPSYTSPRNYGDRYLSTLHSGPVVIQEKIDGSQFAFKWDEAGELSFRTRKCKDPEVILKSFGPLVEHLRALPAQPGHLVFRGEAMLKAKQNKLKYDRAAKNGLVLFDVEDWSSGELHYPTPVESVMEFAEVFDFDAVQVVEILETDKIYTKEMFSAHYESVDSVLGGKIEGVVLKNYAERDPADGKLLVAKYVSDEFRESMKVRPMKIPSNHTLFLEKLGKSVCTEARWDKAIQHLREQGELTGTAKDIGPLMRELHADIEKECIEDVKEALWDEARKTILKSASTGFPQYYLEQIAQDEMAAR